MKTISMDYTEYQNDLSQARRVGIRSTINLIKEAMEYPDDGSRFDFLVTELEELGVSLAKAMNMVEPELPKPCVNDFCEEDVPF